MWFGLLLGFSSHLVFLCFTEIRTYSVVPLNAGSGLLEWVPNTTPFRTLVHDMYSRSKLSYSVRKFFPYVGGSNVFRW
jgi:hypothetical protein